MHVMQIFNYQRVVDTVECLGEINEPKDDSMGDSLVNSCMDEMEESD